MAAPSTEPKGIYKIPNELLVKILAFVPFIPPSPSYIGKPGAFGSHDQLRQVDDRFRDVIDSAALRLQTVRCQFPELAALRGLTAVSPTELTNFSSLDSDVRLATDKVTKEDSDESFKHAIFTTLHLLSYMSSVVDNKRHDWTNACLVIWARKHLFSSKWLQVLRYAVHCVFDRLFPIMDDFAVMLHEDPFGVLIREHGDGRKADIPRMLRRRCLETAILLQNHTGPLHAKIIEEDPSDFADHIDALHGRLCDIFICWRPIAAGSGSELTEEFEKALDFVQGMTWRMLTKEPEDEWINLTPRHVSKIVRPYVCEAYSDVLLHRDFEISRFGNIPSITIREMRDAGSFLRKAHATIATKGVPGRLQRFAEASGLSLIMSLVYDSDESGSGEAEEDTSGTDEGNGSDGEDEAESNMDVEEDTMDEDR